MKFIALVLLSAIIFTADVRSDAGVVETTGAFLWKGQSVFYFSAIGQVGNRRWNQVNFGNYDLSIPDTLTLQNFYFENYAYNGGPIPPGGSFNDNWLDNNSSATLKIYRNGVNIYSTPLRQSAVIEVNRNWDISEAGVSIDLLAGITTVGTYNFGFQLEWNYYQWTGSQVLTGSSVSDSNGNFTLNVTKVPQPPTIEPSPTLPPFLNYQGRILQKGQPFSGKGYFVFALYEGQSLVWTNKYSPGATPSIPEPLNLPSLSSVGDAMELEVRNGAFSVKLGTSDQDNTPNNRPLATEPYFFDSKVTEAARRVKSNLRMEVWFSPAAGSPFTKLSPDIKFATVPFAHMAAVALSVAGGGIAPSGTVVPYAGPQTPEGWVLCDGAPYPEQDPKYARLAQVIGANYNTGGEPAGHFRVPDMRGRTAIGSGKGDTWSGAGGSTSWALGMKFGSEKHILTEAEMPSHNHGVTDPGHSHGVSDPGHSHFYIDTWQNDERSDTDSDDRWYASYLETSETRRTVSSTTGISIAPRATGISLQSKGESQPYNIMQPILVSNFIIKL